MGEQGDWSWEAENSAIKDGIMPGRRVFEKSGNDCHGRLVPDSSLQRVDTRACRERENEREEEESIGRYCSADL